MVATPIFTGNANKAIRICNATAISKTVPSLYRIILVSVLVPKKRNKMVTGRCKKPPTARLMSLEAVLQPVGTSEYLYVQMSEVYWSGE